MSDHKKFLGKKRQEIIFSIKKISPTRTPKSLSKKKINFSQTPQPFSTKSKSSSSPYKFNSNLDEMQEKLSTENQRHSLISISKLVYQYLSDIENTTGNDVTEHIKKELHPKKNDQSNQKNIQRRVYDAINVMCAVGIINKNKQEIKFLQKINKENANKENKSLNEKNDINIEIKQDSVYFDDKIKEKKIELDEKRSCLIRNYLTIKFYEKYNKLNDNNPQRKYQKKMEFPFDVITYDTSSQIKITSKEDLSRYLIVSNSPFIHFTPYDIIKKLVSPDILPKLNEENNNANNININQNKTNSKKSTNEESINDDLNINLNNNLNNYIINEEEEKKVEEDPKKIKILNESFININSVMPTDTKIVINNPGDNNNNNNEANDKYDDNIIFNYLKNIKMFKDELIVNQYNQFGINYNNNEKNEINENNENNENNKEEIENNFEKENENTFTEQPRLRKNSNISYNSNLYDENIMKQNKGDYMSENWFA